MFGHILNRLISMPLQILFNHFMHFNLLIAPKLNLVVCNGCEKGILCFFLLLFVLYVPIAVLFFLTMIEESQFCRLISTVSKPMKIAVKHKYIISKYWVETSRNLYKLRRSQ